MGESKLFEVSATEIVSLMRSSAVSAQEVSRAFLERTRAIDGYVHAWVSVDEEYVMAQAAQIDGSAVRGPLAGVPVGIKDIFNTEFYPTEKGSAAWAGYRAGNDARCVSYLRNASGIVFGKTDTSELAVHAGGKARNPYRLSHVTGSSSGGSAAAVATAMVPAALGTQTGGSTIRPASWCGVYAMKPSFGLIPRTGVLKTTDTLDTVGFFTRSVPDLELMLDTLRVHGANFPIHERRLKMYRDSVGGKWRIGFCTTHLWDATESYVKDRLAELRNVLERTPGIEVLDVQLPRSTGKCHDVHRRIYHPDLGYYLKNEMKKAPSALSPRLMEIFEDSKSIPADDYPQALEEQASMAAELQSFFTEQRLDAIFLNSSNGSAPLGSEPGIHKDLNPLWTLTWLPVINVPQFRCPAGLPFGLQVVGPKFGDYKLLALLRDLDERGVIPRRSHVASAPFPP